MEHIHRHGILGPKGLLTPGSGLSAILIGGIVIGGIVVLLAGQSAYTQVGQDANRVLVGPAAFGDWHNGQVKLFHERGVSRVAVQVLQQGSTFV
jgi:hypothetical protein